MKNNGVGTIENGNADVTGFKFLNTPPYNLGPMLSGGNFGLLTNLLISNYPTIKITYTNANFSSFKQAWSEKVRVRRRRVRTFVYVALMSVGSFV